MSFSHSNSKRASISLNSFVSSFCLLFLLFFVTVLHIQRWWRNLLNGHLEKNSIELQKAARQKIARKQYEQRKRFTQMQSNKKIAQKRQLDDYQYKQWKSMGESSFEAPFEAPFERQSSLEGHKRDQSASGCCLSSMPHLDKFDTMTLGGCLHALGSGDHAVLQKQRASQCVNVLPLTADEIQLMQLIKQNKLQQLTQTNSNKQTNKSSSGGKSSLDSGKSSSSSTMRAGQ